MTFIASLLKNYTFHDYTSTSNQDLSSAAWSSFAIATLTLGVGYYYLRTKIWREIMVTRVPQSAQWVEEIKSSTASTQSSENSVRFQAAIKTEFLQIVKAFLLKKDPLWIMEHKNRILQSLEEVPDNLHNYTHAPSVGIKGIKIKFDCTEGNYKLVL